MHTLLGLYIQKKVIFDQTITFAKEDLIGIVSPHDDVLVVINASQILMSKGY